MYGILVRPHFSSSSKVSDTSLYPVPTSKWKANIPFFTFATPSSSLMNLGVDPFGAILFCGDWITGLGLDEDQELNSTKRYQERTTWNKRYKYIFTCPPRRSTGYR
uniref:Uncharacterized protein n=1 Tax=Timema cristinae TaxID=61476 RepID=A0A7R9D7F4_TIMCR|nr:unnamed protein product [Timema cristinae]